MADDPNPNPEPGNPPADPPADPPSDPNPEPYFVAKTKDEYEGIFGPTRIEGRDSERKAILEKAQGAKSIDDLVEAWNNANELARQLEGEEVQQIRSDYESKIEAERESAAALRKEYALKDALRDAGINGERLPLALKVADLDKISIKDGNVQGVEEAVNGVKESSPEWFGGTSIGRGSAPGEPEGGGNDVWSMPTDDFLALQQRVMTGQQGP
jgi:hypothetical protein